MEARWWCNVNLVKKSPTVSYQWVVSSLTIKPLFNLPWIVYHLKNWGAGNRSCSTQQDYTLLLKIKIEVASHYWLGSNSRRPSESHYPLTTTKNPLQWDHWTSISRRPDLIAYPFFSEFSSTDRISISFPSDACWWTTCGKQEWKNGIITSRRIDPHKTKTFFKRPATGRVSA